MDFPTPDAPAKAALLPPRQVFVQIRFERVGAGVRRPRDGEYREARLTVEVGIVRARRLVAVGLGDDKTGFYPVMLGDGKQFIEGFEYRGRADGGNHAKEVVEVRERGTDEGIFPRENLVDD